MKTNLLPDRLLDREQFHELCMERAGGLCLLCAEPAVDAHHIFERKLFPDGGYRLSNAAALCGPCHWKAEIGQAPPIELLDKAAIASPLLPPHALAAGLSGLAGAARLDKWGNLLRDDGSIAPGPLFADDGCRKAMASSGRLALAYEAGDFPPPRLSTPA